MRVARVVTNETCNQACRFCDARRPRERASIAAAAIVRKKIAEAIATGAQELVLTGGEPTLRADLAALIATAVSHGVRVSLETNAALIDGAMAERLAAAGLHAVRVHLPGWGENLDAITTRPGDALATYHGILALEAASIEVHASVPIVAENLATVASLPAALADAGVTLTHAWLRLPTRAPDSASIAPLRPMLDAAAQFVEQARAHALPTSLAPATFLPPCLFARPARVASIYALTPGGATRPGFSRAPSCQDCSVVDRCPGLPAGIPATETQPIRNDRLRRRLTVIRSIPAQIDRELVTHEVHRRADGSTTPAAIIRVGFRCNQACHFCFVSTHLPSPPATHVEAAIDAIAAKRGVLVLSGGEPTLEPRLLDYVRRGRSRGVAEIELQTNATRLGGSTLPQDLAEAGVDIAFVSLHGATAATSDRVTATPGTFERTVEGIDALCRTTITVRLNFVFCELNRAEFPAFVSLVASRWPSAELTVSFVGMSTDLVPRERWLVPRYRDVVAPLAQGLRLAKEHGLVVGGFDSMCGLPLCLVPDDIRPFLALAELAEGADSGEFTKPAPCERCVLKSRCFGLRRGYAQMYGWDELQPVTTPPTPAVP